MLRAFLMAGLLTAGGQAQPAVPAPPFQTLFYTSEGLRLEAYLFRPDGPGPFPLVVYNHGSRAADARSERPLEYVARLLLPQGYAVLVPERRGYGKSEGATLVEEIGTDRGAKFVARLEAEARDALAAVDYVTGRPELRLDAKRMAMVGYSFGGMVTTIAMGRDRRFAAAVAQAPGARNWIDKPDIQGALMKAARLIRTPMFCAVAENDTQTESTRAICEAVRASQVPAEVKIYPRFVPPGAAEETAGVGHAIFGPAGVAIWRDDLVAFLRKYLSR
jgi:carboxymethylenebutenolidase